MIGIGILLTIRWGPCLEAGAPRRSDVSLLELFTQFMVEVSQVLDGFHKILEGAEIVASQVLSRHFSRPAHKEFLRRELLVIAGRVIAPESSTPGIVILDLQSAV